MLLTEFRSEEAILTWDSHQILCDNNVLIRMVGKDRQMCLVLLGQAVELMH